ncbi:hypothetical protein B0H21DRAFT_78780 [Amylocystis lapponica]|nr:hypothetical protein B0H21DRAFT_78780 [Amylocystis lapponica]
MKPANTFWGLTVRPGRKTIVVPEDANIRITNIALEAGCPPIGTAGRTSVNVISVKKSAYMTQSPELAVTVCTLIPGKVEQCGLDILLPAAGEFIIEVIGTNIICLAGVSIASDLNEGRTTQMTGPSNVMSTSAVEAMPDSQAMQASPSHPIQPAVPSKNTAAPVVLGNKDGTGAATVNGGSTVGIRYLATYELQGKVVTFSANTKGPLFTFKMGDKTVMQGLQMGLIGMKAAGERKILIPPELVKGEETSVPPDVHVTYGGQYPIDQLFYICHE